MLLEAISGNATDAREEEVDEVGAWEAPLASLLNTLTTLVVGLAVVCLLQLLLIALWKFWVNRRYYARQRLKLMKSNAKLATQAKLAGQGDAKPADTHYSADDIDSLAFLPGVQHRPTKDQRMSSAKLSWSDDVSAARAKERGAIADILAMKKELSSDRLSRRAEIGGDEDPTQRRRQELLAERASRRARATEGLSEEERARQQTRRERLEKRRASLNAAGVEAASKERAGRVVYTDERKEYAARQLSNQTSRLAPHVPLLPSAPPPPPRARPRGAGRRRLSSRLMSVATRLGASWRSAPRR